jgi:hypothetical protein
VSSATKAPLHAQVSDVLATKMFVSPTVSVPDPNALHTSRTCSFDSAHPPQLSPSNFSGVRANFWLTTPLPLPVASFSPSPSQTMPAFKRNATSDRGTSRKAHFAAPSQYVLHSSFCLLLCAFIPLVSTQIPRVLRFGNTRQRDRPNQRTTTGSLRLCVHTCTT